MDKKFQLRMSLEEKEKLDKLSSFACAKNNSDFIRKYINTMYDLVFSEDVYNLDEIIHRLRDEKDRVNDPWSSYSIQNKISLLEEIKNTYLPKQP